FTPIALVVRVPFILVVNPSLPIESVADLISYAKAHPGALTYGSGGAGSPHQLYAEMFKTMTGIEMTHVPYKGSAPALTDVMGGHCAFLFAGPAPGLAQIKGGKGRAVGGPSGAPLPAAPDYPAAGPTGARFGGAGWGMVVAPARTPAAIVSK